MRTSYIQYFSDFENRIRKQRRNYWLIREIDRASRDHKLRSDAFVFLHMNIEMMIARPYFIEDYYDPSIYFEDGRMEPDRGFREMVRSDLRKIIRNASILQDDDPQFRERLVKGITANAIVRTLAKLGDEVRMQADDFWGP